MIASEASFQFSALIGHEKAQNTLLSAFKSRQLHHGWMFSGPRGIGKFKTAMHFAALLLGANADRMQINPQDHIAHLLMNGSHPDLRVIQRPIDDKGKRKSEIPVVSARELSAFFALRPAMGGWRVAIIDSIDEMNKNASNALLKTLEEPPEKAILIVISHGETSLLSTIRSRCQKLCFSKLPNEEAAAILMRDTDCSRAEADNSLGLVPGRPGKAKDLMTADALSAATAVARLIERKEMTDTKALADLLTSASRSEEAFEAAFMSVYSKVEKSAINAQDGIVAGLWAKVYASVAQTEMETKRLKQDRSQAVSKAISTVQTALRVLN